ncbi:MAG: hypothetical protein WBA76_17585 [Phormidesmis sp.]
MTYTTQSNFSKTQTEQTAPSTVEKLKTLKEESTTRYQRVSKILKAAFSETAAEFKAGKAVISPLAKEVTAETVATVKDKGQQAKQTVNQAWQSESETEDRTEKLIRLVRVLAKSAQDNLLPQLKTQALKLDDLLSERYGDRYTTFKGRFDLGRYTTPAKTTAEETVTDRPVVIEVNSEVIR